MDCGRKVRFTCTCLFYYVLSYIFVFYCMFSSSSYCRLCRVPVFMRTSDMTGDVGSCWTVLLALVWTLSLAGLVARQLAPCLFRNDRHNVAWPCLPRSWNPLAFRLQHWLSLQNCRLFTLVRYSLFRTFASHLTLTDT